MGCFCICDFRGWTCVLSLKGWAMGTGMDSHLSIGFSWEEKLGAKSCSFLVNALTPAQSLSDQAPEAGCSGKTEKLLCKIACSLHRSAYNSTPPPTLRQPFIDAAKGSMGPTCPTAGSIPDISHLPLGPVVPQRVPRGSYKEGIEDREGVP